MALLLVLGSSLPAGAETLVEKVNETRTYLYFKIADALAQSILPAGWQPVAVPQGPAKGANLILVLIDRLLATDAQRKPLEPATNRLLVAVLSARDTASDAAGPVVVGGISAEPKGAPGAYRTYVAGKVELSRSARDGEVDEDWEAEVARWRPADTGPELPAGRAGAAELRSEDLFGRRSQLLSDLPGRLGRRCDPQQRRRHRSGDPARARGERAAAGQAARRLAGADRRQRGALVSA